ncbi:MAG: glycoside hydrolase family 15 protein [Thermoplasmata archaeon]|nr:glycoside hydrolase family 15 protein [Thermoplasmata archaeon]
MAPRWSHSNKDGIGTAYSADSRLWYTLWRGIVTEVYFPTIDMPQLRDLEFLFTDGSSFFHEEKRDLTPKTERPVSDALLYRVHSEAPGGRYRLHKTVLSAPHLPCLLLRSRLEILDPDLRGGLRLFVLAAPHLNVGGWDNSGSVQEILGRDVLIAEKDGVALAMAADRPFRRASVGYVGHSDGWTDLRVHHGMEWEYDQAPDGNIALTGEVDLADPEGFTVGLAFGTNSSAAVSALFQGLGMPFETAERRFLAQWGRTARRDSLAGPRSTSHGDLFDASRAILLAHEDKTYPGAFIASLSIPWGSSKGDEDSGGYHLVWVRDLFHAATGLLACGVHEAPLRALIYLATRQQPDGGFPQNFWLDGRPYWQGIQLDEVAFPILLAGKLQRLDGLAEFDPTPMVLRAAHFLADYGPPTQQDRWEELGGYSPSTLATTIAALTVAGQFARRAGLLDTATFVEEYADFLEAHVEAWTVTTEGTLVPGIPRHYVRIRPSSVDDPDPDEGHDLGRVHLSNLAPGTPSDFPASEIVDGGFLDLVRLGLRRPDDPIVVDSLRVLDQILRVETPYGPVWRRYNHDGYGETAEGGPFNDFGIGRAWPLLTGERGHYELARGADAQPYLRAMERFATSTGLLPEQVWDEADRPARHLELGRPTESATPLVWAHAEYVKLRRSVLDGEVFDRVPEVVERYLRPHAARPSREIWKFNRRITQVDAGAQTRVIASAPFRLHVSRDGWTTVEDRESHSAGIGLHYVDLEALESDGRAWTFTFYWPLAEHWEGRDFRVESIETHFDGVGTHEGRPPPADEATD